MSRRHLGLPGETERPSSRGATVACWAVLAAVGVVGLATPGADPERLAPTPAHVGLTAAESPASPVALTQAAAAQAQPAAAAQAAAEPKVSHAVAALKVALSEIGLPYVWGGNGPANGDAGFDCSGLTHFAYATAGVALPRTAHTQFYAGPHVPANQPLEPGDLVFYGTPSFVHHVGMYIGAGRMVNAPTFGEAVQVAYYRWPGDDYIGATRPDGSSATGLFQLPFIPEAYGPLPSAPTPRAVGPFVAPRASLPGPLPVLVASVPVPEAQSAATAITEERQLGVAAPPASSPAPTLPESGNRPALSGSSTGGPLPPTQLTSGAAAPATAPAAVPSAALSVVGVAPPTVRSSSPPVSSVAPAPPAAAASSAAPPRPTAAAPVVPTPTAVPPTKKLVVPKKAPVVTAVVPKKAPVVPAVAPKKAPVVPAVAPKKAPVAAAVPKTVVKPTPTTAPPAIPANSDDSDPTMTAKPTPTSDS